MHTLTISQLRSTLPSVVDDVYEFTNRVVVSVSGKPKAIMMSIDELESLEETAEILSVPHAYKTIQKGSKEASLKKGIRLEDLKIS